MALRWEQRFLNFTKAFYKLTEAVTYIRDQSQYSNDLLKDGIIQRFEYTHELAWNVMKDYAGYQGIKDVGGSRDATREAFQMGLIKNGEVWMDMIISRNKTTHTYEEDTANDIYNRIINDYHAEF
jgi:nucleotidyltransferase substrate binding protein (TIGR01987 family)